MTGRFGVLTTSFPDTARDASGGFVARMCTALAASGPKIEVLAPRTPKACARYDADMAKKGVEITRLPYAPMRRWETLFHGAGAPDNIAANPWQTLLVPGAVSSLLRGTSERARRYDALMTHWLLPCGLVGAQRSRPYVHAAFCHGSDLHLLEKLRARALARRIAVNTDALCFVSEHLKTRFADLVGEAHFKDMGPRAFVTPMGVDPTEVAFTTEDRARARRDLGIRGPAVLFLGRLVPLKGARVLIDAAEHLKGWTVLIAGDGPQRAALERRALDKRVRARFFGRVGPVRRRALLAAADAFALPSRVEASGRSDNLPVSLLEAMSAGKKVIASDTGAVPELVIHNETGLLIPPDDPAKLASALRKAFETPAAEHWGRKAQEAVADRNWDAVAARILRLVDDLPRRNTD